MDDIPVIKEYRLSEYFQELSRDSLYPSAGSSAAMTAAHAAALFAMACRVNLRKIEAGLTDRESSRAGSSGKKSSEAGALGKASCAQGAFWQEALQGALKLLEQLLALAQADGFAIKDYFEGMPGGAEKATAVPLEIARCAEAVIALAARVLPQSYVPVRADIECARCLAMGSKAAALAVARCNLPLLHRDRQKSYAGQIEEIEKNG